MEVGYFDEHDDKLNSFQLIIVDNGDGSFDLIFNYDGILWETGDASDGENGFGGTSAAFGFSTGDGDPAHQFIANGSFQNGGLLDSNGTTGLIHGHTGSEPDGRYIFHIAAPTGPKLSGTVEHSSDPESGALVEICPVAGGVCITRSANSDGQYTARGLTPGADYNVQGHPGPGSSNTNSPMYLVHFPGSGDATRDIEMGDPLDGPPPGTSITNIGTTDDGIPVAFWTDPLALSTQGCEGGTATYSIEVEGVERGSGSMTEGPAGTYTATAAALAPYHGQGAVHIHIDCPSTTDEDTDFGLYIDPSGFVRDSAGNPIEGATVTLYRSASASGPFFPVPDGSAVMSPSNRRNSDSTTADGRFGWDVVSGYYKVRAEADGCVSDANRSQSFAETDVMTIPPPVTNLDLRLYCPPPAGSGEQPRQTTTPGPVIRPAPLPSNEFTFGKLNLKKKTITVNVPGPGTLVLSDGSVKAKVQAAAKKKKKAKALIRKVTKNVTKAGKVTLTIALTPAGKKALAKKKTLKVKARITFTPTGGAAKTKIKPVTFKVAKKKKKH